MRESRVRKGSRQNLDGRSLLRIFAKELWKAQIVANPQTHSTECHIENGNPIARLDMLVFVKDCKQVNFSIFP